MAQNCPQPKKFTVFQATTVDPEANDQGKVSQATVVRQAWTPSEWTNQVLREADMSRVVGHLRAWMPEKREREATEETIQK